MGCWVGKGIPGEVRGGRRGGGWFWEGGGALDLDRCTDGVGE